MLKRESVANVVFSFAVICRGRLIDAPEAVVKLVGRGRVRCGTEVGPNLVPALLMIHLPPWLTSPRLVRKPFRRVDAIRIHGK